MKDQELGAGVQAKSDTNGKSRLPRPKSVVGLASLAKMGATSSRSNEDVVDEDAPPAPKKVKTNAFSVLMAGAKMNKGKGKEKVATRDVKTVQGNAKAKEPAKGEKTSVAVAVAGPSKVVKRQYGKQTKQQQAQEKAGIKAKMRPREKPKPVAGKSNVPTTGHITQDECATIEQSSNEPPPVPEPEMEPQLHQDEPPQVVAPSVETGSVPVNVTDTVPDAMEISDIADPTPMPILAAVASQPSFPEPTIPAPVEEAPPVPELSTNVPETVEAMAEEDKSTPAIPEAPKPPPPVKASRPRVKKPTPQPQPGGVGRMTRSASLKRKEAANATETGLVRKKSFSFSTTSSVSGPSSSSTAKKPAPKPAIKPIPSVKADALPKDSGQSTSSLSDARSSGKEVITAPGSPMKVTSPMKRPVSKAPSSHQGGLASPSKSPSKPKFSMGLKSGPSSPTKLVRAASFSTRPKGTVRFSSYIKMLLINTVSIVVSRPFSVGSSKAGPSSLSNLATALEKLRMPPPSRPNTSMGFTADKGGGEDATTDTSVENTGENGGTGIGTSRPGALVRASSVGPGVLGGATSSKTDMGPPSTTTTATLKQQPMSMFFHGMSGSKSLQAGRVGGAIMRGRGTSDKPRIFGVGGSGFGMGRGRIVQKVSRKTSLPSVMASPVKGGDGPAEISDDAATQEARGTVESTGRDEDVFMDDPSSSNTPVNNDVSSLLSGSIDSDKGKGKEDDRPVNAWKKNASRRASLASQALSQSLSSLPVAPLGSMGPPETPAGPGNMRSASSNFPPSAFPLSSAGEPSSGSRSSSRLATRSSTRIMTSAKSAPGALEKIKGGTGGHVSSSRKTKEEQSDPATESLKVMKDCVIFVDVRTDDGDDAGGLFVDMLKGLGARVSDSFLKFHSFSPSSSSRFRRELARDAPILCSKTGYLVH